MDCAHPPTHVSHPCIRTAAINMLWEPLDINHVFGLCFIAAVKFKYRYRSYPEFLKFRPYSRFAYKARVKTKGAWQRQIGKHRRLRSGCHTDDETHHRPVPSSFHPRGKSERSKARSVNLPLVKGCPCGSASSHSFVKLVLFRKESETREALREF